MDCKKYRTSTWYDTRLVIRPSSIQGKGMFAAFPIKEGEIIAVIGGEVMIENEFMAFAEKASKFNAIQIGEDRHLIDISIPPELMDGSINHSCDSNTWMIDEVTIAARKDILQGEEVTVDYSLFTSNPDWILKECQCGLPVCRHTPSGNDWKIKSVQEQYANHFSPYINERIKNFNSDKNLTERPSGGKLYQRPYEVKACKKCGAPAGRNYASCEECYSTIEDLWLTDWKELLKKENIESDSDDEKLLAEVIVEEIDKHPWTIVDFAMSIVKCKTCGSELGGGPIDCPNCSFAFGNLWSYDMEAMNHGKMTGNEHALRVGRWVLRYPHRQKEKAVESWKFSMPILITGKMATTHMGQFFRKVINDGKFDLSSKIYQSFEEAYTDVVKGGLFK